MVLRMCAHPLFVWSAPRTRTLATAKNTRSGGNDGLNVRMVQRKLFGWQLKQISSHDCLKYTQAILANVRNKRPFYSLGVTIDKDLHFSEHISVICKKSK